MNARRTFATRYRGVDMPHIGFAVSRAEWDTLLSPPLGQESAQIQPVSPASVSPGANR